MKFEDAGIWTDERRELILYLQDVGDGLLIDKKR